ncbi:MAG: tRNA (guanosine(46)-N7)-methyltransferase TrmB [Simkaniaceae bacterium]|nr:tRNA (guanosine(46)-N7)-methyltransferase TrmB [Candidatus Sacchlamyda saccharinae]
MKPKNLKFPFTWKERRPAVHEGVLIVPQHFEEHDLWEAPEGLFPSDRPICVEFCSGNGDWIIERAKKNPEKLWVAVEMQFERVRKIWSKMHNESIKNLLIVCGKAQEFTKFYLPKSSVDEVYVNFPDPWPKERHAKHRLIQTSFIDMLSDVVKNSGVATYATDDPTYSAQMIDVMLSHPIWENILPKPYYEQNWDDYGHSWFRNLWEEKGRNFYYMQFKKI